MQQLILELRAQHFIRVAHITRAAGLRGANLWLMGWLFAVCRVCLPSSERGRQRKIWSRLIFTDVTLLASHNKAKQQRDLARDTRPSCSLKHSSSGSTLRRAAAHPVVCHNSYFKTKKGGKKRKDNDMSGPLYSSRSLWPSFLSRLSLD